MLVNMLAHACLDGESGLRCPARLSFKISCNLLDENKLLDVCTRAFFKINTGIIWLLCQIERKLCFCCSSGRKRQLPFMLGLMGSPMITLVGPSPFVFSSRIKFSGN